MKMIIIQ